MQNVIPVKLVTEKLFTKQSVASYDKKYEC